MCRFNLKICFCVAAIAGVLAVALPAQAAIVYSEDFEGEASYPTLNLLPFGFSGVSPLSNTIQAGAGTNLGTNVALLPPAAALWAKPLAGLADDLITLQYDGYVTGLGIGGKGMVGVRDSGGSVDAQSGVFVGINGKKWRVDYRGLTGGLRVNISTSGVVGGPDFLGAVSVPFIVKTVIDKNAGTNGEIRVDILKRSDLSVLNPTFTIGLTATEQADIANLDQVALYWNADWTPTEQLVEVDNLLVTSIPEPSSILLLSIALSAVVLRRHWLL